MTCVVLIVLYAVFRRAPRTWWIWATIVVIVFTILGIILAPVYIEPLFNKYKPLEDPAISQPILAMAQANQIPVDKVFRSGCLEANQTGQRQCRRVSRHDPHCPERNLLKQCTLPEIREVMAHEMGHYVLNHNHQARDLLRLVLSPWFSRAPRLFSRVRSPDGVRAGACAASPTRPVYRCSP